jgi:predicted DCC family thiol-disulfide oxidoreductase YuxK
VTTPPEPLLVFDGDCSFCRRWIARWRAVTGERVTYVPFQEAAERFPEVPRAAFAEAVHFRDASGTWSRGAEAVFRSLATAPGHAGSLWLHCHVPGFAFVTERAYRAVARHRDAADRVTTLLWGHHVVPPGERLTSWIFLRALGLVYLVAFVSLWVQILGLAGSGGILPAGPFLHQVGEDFGASRYWLAPTLLWTGAGDGALVGWCAAGTALSVLLVLGAAPAASLFGLWAIYLSLATVCRDFLWFQWDGLLLEAGFLAIFLAPLRLWSRPRSDPPPPRVAVFLLRWLLFRLMVSSAAVKLASGDPTWRSLTALRYHYETQPLPPWTAWYAHHLPAAVHTVSALGMFGIEGLAPFLIWAPRRLRFAGAALLAFLQVLILVTGNYGFFNFLTLALCLMLLDDGVWPRSWTGPGGRGDPVVPAAAAPDAAAGAPGRKHAWPRAVPRVAALVLVPMSLVPFLGALDAPTGWLGPVPAVVQAAAPLRTVNPYGLFAVMTVHRPEILLEGSTDGTEWRPYSFRYKVGDPGRRPRFVAPHMPRLDWQMWFAALQGTVRRGWFLNFCDALLRGSPPVLHLLAGDPFPDGPPRFLRATVWEYHFTDPSTRRTTGDWWVRTRSGPYCPVLTLRDGMLAPAGPELPSSPSSPSQPSPGAGADSSKAAS